MITIEYAALIAFMISCDTLLSKTATSVISRVQSLPSIATSILSSAWNQWPAQLGSQEIAFSASKFGIKTREENDLITLVRQPWQHEVPSASFLLWRSGSKVIKLGEDGLTCARIANQLGVGKTQVSFTSWDFSLSFLAPPLTIRLIKCISAAAYRYGFGRVNRIPNVPPSFIQGQML